MQVLSVVFVCAFGFKLGMPLALGYHFSFFQFVTVTSLGGILGVFVFTYLDDWVLHKWYKVFPRKPHPEKKKFTFMNKLIIRVKRRFGLIGLSLITPGIISFPVGIFLAIRYFHNKQKIRIYMIASALIWSVTVATFKLLLRI